MANNGTLDGFRLERLEVYNWGTFNDIHILPLYGQTALLTGANGSGKSTLVDALVTLLIPPFKRLYNIASGTSKRRERHLKTYVQGHYGHIRDDEGGARIQQLRGNDSYTVILGVFRNYSKNLTVTMAQIMWFEGQDIDTLFIVANQELSIKEHIFFKKDVEEFRQRMKRIKVHVDRKYSAYFSVFQKMIGIRSEKALDLFNQIVSIKEIGNLTQFIRNNMLEALDTEAEIDKLREQYQNLMEAYGAIEQAERQLSMLGPMLEDAKKYEDVAGKVAQFQRATEALPYFFAAREVGLREEAHSIHEQEKVTLTDKVRRLKSEIDALSQQRRRLERDIESDEVGKQEATLQDLLNKASASQTKRKALANEYDKMARMLEIASYDGQPATFHNNRTKIEYWKSDADTHRNHLQTERDNHILAVSKHQENIDTLQGELDDLRSRRTQIPSDNLRARNQIAESLGIDETQLPFVGELLRVREDESTWLGAIERLLNGFARQILVPDHLYPKVRKFINDNHLRTKVVYQRVQEGRGDTRRKSFPVNTVPTKLNIHPNTPFDAWLHNRLAEGFAYVCCQTVSDFDQYDRAISLSGQIKHSAERHEKDDRSRINDHRNYVLGWDNAAKINAIEQQLADERAKLKTTQHALHRVESDQRALDSQREHYVRFLSAYTDFEALDWHADRDEIAQLQTQLAVLRQQSDRLRALRDQLNALAESIKAKEKEHTLLNQNIGGVQHQIEANQQALARSSVIFNQMPLGISDDFQLVEARLRGEEIMLETLNQRRESAGESLRKAISAQSKQIETLAGQIASHMTKFRAAFFQLGLNLGEDVRSIGEYRRLYENIQHHDLPSHKERFAKLLNRKVTDAFVAFRSKLNNHADDIKESVEHLNQALKPIRYTPSTYIRLRAEMTHDTEVAQFRRDIAMAGDYYSDEDETVRFDRIRQMIERFSADERWMKKVSDVRQWFEFGAEEVNRSTNATKESYNDTAGKSGGQKAKMAYTIMASALAYQYGLDDQTLRGDGFRFVVVDEAFSKSDESNAHYAMQLFKELGLQLLVVTPKDKTHIVDPFIETCNLTVNTEEENRSSILTLTLQELHDRMNGENPSHD